MTRYIQNITKIIFVIIPIVFLPIISFANPANNLIDMEDSSIYKYNALQNEVNFNNTINSIESFEDELESNTDKQNISVERSEDAISAIKNKGRVKTFFVGNSSGMGILKFQMVQMKDQSSSLNTLMLKTKDNKIKAQINSQMDILEKEQKKIEDFIIKYDNKFSLFGWFISSL